MILRELLSELSLVAQCRKYGIPLWQCPQFLFLVMGLVIGLSSIVSYILGRRLVEDPQLVALLIIVLVTVLLTISFVITKSFERLVEAARLKSEFVSIVSHQLRSPLSNLKWALEFLLSGRAGSIGEPQLEYFRILKENSQRMQELVNDLLTVSRIEEGNIPFQKKEFLFDELLRSVVEEFDPFIRASNVSLGIQGPQASLKVVSDPVHIRHVLENLLENAIRYTWKASGQKDERPRENVVRIRYRQQGNNLSFEIQDNGVGIPKEDHKYIFRKFFRSGNVLRHETQGSGLGLYIARSVVQGLGGKIGFNSQEGKGSTFWFTIPVA